MHSVRLGTRPCGRGDCLISLGAEFNMALAIALFAAMMSIQSRLPVFHKIICDDAFELVKMHSLNASVENRHWFKI